MMILVSWTMFSGSRNQSALFNLIIGLSAFFCVDENEMYNMLDNKTNMYCEVMLVKTALYQYRMNIVNGNKESAVQIRPLKSKEYYNVYIRQLACNANITPITKHLDSY